MENQLTRLVSPAGAFDFKYDDLSRMTQMTYPNGMRTEMSYEGDTRLSKVEHIKQGIFEKTQSLFKYDYDYNDNKTRMKTFRRALPTNETLNYTYDKKDQLLTATNPLRGLADESFIYDLAGNLLRQQGQSQDSTYNENNQLTDDGTYTYKYDSKGNLTEKTHKADKTVTRYHWDIENQLTQVTNHETETALPSETITYAYDALGRRIEKAIKDESGNETVKKYVYDNEDILMEFNKEGSMERYYVHGLGIDDPLAMLTDNKETRNDPMDFKTYYYHKDGMGSVTSLTDESGDEKEKYIYNAFGKMTIYDERDNKIEESQVGNPYSFTGREHDSETGLHYHRARYYSPDLARWLSEDPIEFNSGDMNLYRYVMNNPLKWIDLFGDKASLCKRDIRNFSRFRGKTYQGYPVEHHQLCIENKNTPSHCIGFQPSDHVEVERNPNFGNPECTEIDKKNCPAEEDFDNCIKNYLPTKDYKLLEYNCQDFAKEAIEACQKNCKGWDNFLNSIGI